MAPQTVIGVDLGGTHVRAGRIAHLRVESTFRHRADLARRAADADRETTTELVVDAIAHAIGDVMPADGVDAIGVSVPGFVDGHRGIVHGSPNLPAMREVPLAAALEERLGVPVVLENDAMAAAWGEYRLHPDQPASLVYFGLGTGVGGGVVLDGRPYTGRGGMAMEVGHLVVEPNGRRCGCGSRGCVETYASATGISQTYHDRTGRAQDARWISEAAEAGDSDAREALRLAGEQLGRAIAHVVKVLDVHHIVIGGGASGAWPLMQRHVYHALDGLVFEPLRSRLKIGPSTANDQAGIIGAADLALWRAAPLHAPAGAGVSP